MMATAKNLIFVAIGGGAGSTLRFLFSKLVANTSFPYSTLLINIGGSFLIGILFALSLSARLSNNVYLLLATGLCGGFTTFSAFSLENVLLLKSGNYTTAFLYMVISIISCVAAAFAGLLIFKP